MLEFCLGSYLIIAALATVLMISVLIAGKRSDHIRYRLHFWSALPAKRDERMRFEVLELDDEDLFQPGNEKVRLPQPVPPVDI